MQILRRISFVVAPLLLTQLAGCAHYEWQKYGAGQADLNRDIYECQTEAAQTFPTLVVTKELRPGYTTPETTRCRSTGAAYGTYGAVYANSNTNCSTTGGQVIQPITYNSDANSNNRDRSTKSCLIARGYQRVKVSK